MGERLNFEIIHNGETIMNCYRHWSAYTMDAAEYAADFVDAWKRHHTDVHPDAIDEDELLALRLIDTFAELNAGFNDAESTRLMNAFCQNYPTLDLALRHGKYKSVNRDEGLLSITQEGIAETEYWEDGRIIYDIDSGLIDFEVVWFDGEDYNSFRKNYKQNHDEELLLADDEISLIDFELDSIPENKMREVADKFAKVIEHQAIFKTKGGYYTAITG